MNFNNAYRTSKKNKRKASGNHGLETLYFLYRKKQDCSTVTVQTGDVC